uniref:BED-type domain-containing protein n=1 Tax=Romanomermis culicivorax TaxID=13658 RepID=A0A915KTH6_ROMCU
MGYKAPFYGRQCTGCGERNEISLLLTSRGRRTQVTGHETTENFASLFVVVVNRLFSDLDKFWRMTTSTQSVATWKSFTIVTNDETEAIHNYCTKEISRGTQDEHSFGYNGLKKHLASHPLTSIKYLAEQKVVEKNKY